MTQKYLKTRSTSVLGGGWIVTKVGGASGLVGLKMTEPEADQLIARLESGELVDMPVLGSLADSRDRVMIERMREKSREEV